MRVAVIGAGISGLRVARLLKMDGMDVHVFDKARGPSGRLATRRSDAGHFDHGAQYFTARHPNFEKQVEDWCLRGVVAKWEGRVARLEDGLVTFETEPPERFVGAPRMSAIARDLATDLDTSFSTRIVFVEKQRAGYSLVMEDQTRLGGFDLVVSAVPAPQAVPLLALSLGLAEKVSRCRMLPCHALMVQFESDLEVEFDAAFVNASALSWVANNGSKPGRDSQPNWILHSGADWSEAHLESTAEQTRNSLLGAFEHAVGVQLPEVKFFAAHRWLYARSEGDAKEGPLWDGDAGLGACGDWVEGDRVEDAFLSAEVLAEAIRSR